MAAILLALPSAGRAESLVSTLSDAAVEITSNFTGEQIVVFGAVRGAPSEGLEYQVAIVVEGPPQDVIVRRKERLLGIWANRTSRSFDAVPSYYVMHLSENFANGADASQLGQYRLGVPSLSFVQAASAEGTAALFAEALIDLKAAHALYQERENAVEFLAPDVFRTTFFLPSEIPTGDYRVSVYLFRGGAFLAGEAQTLSIVKAGFSERIARAAFEHPLPYGLVCVALALSTGWLAGLVFRRP